MAKKKDAEKIDLVRKILDNPNELSSTKSDRYLETLRYRLRHQYGHHYPKQSYDKSTDSSLKPTVFIHHVRKEEIPPISDETLARAEEKQQVTQPLPVEQDFFKEGEDVFEIERVSDYEIADFIEVKPKEHVTPFQVDKTTQQVDKEVSVESLPKWELVEDTDEDTKIKAIESMEISEKSEGVIEEKAQDDNEPKKEGNEIWEPITPKEHEEPLKTQRIFKRTPKEKPVRDMAESESRFRVKDLKKSIHNLRQKDTKQPYTFKGYTLYQKEIDLGHDKKRLIHFFSKDQPDDAEPSILPDNYEVKINKKTGVPYIRKKQI